MAETSQINPKSSMKWLLNISQRLAGRTSNYILVVIATIGLLLLLSGDFGEAWDLDGCEHSTALAYTYYFNGFDSAYLRANPDTDPYYGPVLDILIRIAQQHTTADPLQQFKIRILLQALFSLSCLIPVFLISARVVCKPLALIAVPLVAATPVFIGHAFINPKDSIFASAFLWAFFLSSTVLRAEEGRAIRLSSVLARSSG
jgi:4-amino-4-deoxy-L-arabinose transferase-like glycosyltransferase